MNSKLKLTGTSSDLTIKYGLLYNWYVVDDSRVIANDGWHVPSYAEFTTLLTTLGGASVAGGKLKEAGLIHWTTPNTGADNNSGFTGRGAGERNASGPFNGINVTTRYLVTDDVGNPTRNFMLFCNSAEFMGTFFFKNAGCSIRLIKDDSTLADYVGNDGKVYPTVKIGDQVWTSRDLNETKYNNGDTIPEVTDNTEWAGLTTGALCAYYNNWDNAYFKNTTSKLKLNALANDEKYGLLYNWYVVEDSRQITSDGWHIPSKAEILTLETTLGGYNCGNDLREVGYAHWEDYGEVATNNSRLTLRGSGSRGGDIGIPESNGLFAYLRLFYNGWLSTDYGTPGWKCTMQVSCFDSAVSPSIYSIGGGMKSEGNAIRLIKDDSTLADYVGNDGKVYPTVKIGDQVWTSRDLNETKYNNGDTIPEVTDNTEWAGLTTGALCAYDNDWNNVYSSFNYDNKLLLGLEVSAYIPPEGPLFQFVIDPSTDIEVNLIVLVSSGILNWDLGDSSTSVDENVITHTYTTTGDKTVKVYKGTTAGASDITYFAELYNIDGSLDISSLNNLVGISLAYSPKLTSIYFPASSEILTTIEVYYCNLIGTIDVSGLINLNNIFLVNETNLTQILNPTSSTLYYNYYIANCNLTGILDVSGLTGLGGIFAVVDNPNLTKILNPVSSEVFTTYAVNNNNLNGTLDISGLTGLGTDFEAYNNPNLTKILNPVSSQPISYYYAYNCNLNGTLDVSGLTGFGGDIKIYNNPNLTSVLFPTSNNKIIWFDASGCALDLTTVDNIFAKIDAYYSVFTPTQYVIINTGSGTNSPPTNCWDNTNIVHLQSIFSVAGKNLTITINASCGSAPVGAKLLEFTTNASTQAFDPSFGVTSGILNWNLGDGSISNANRFSYNYTTPGNKTVRVYIGTTNGSTAITSIDMYYDNLIGTLDVSNLTNLGGDFNVWLNSNLTQIINPDSSQIFNVYYAQYCNLTGTLDVSGLTGLGGQFRVDYNPNLTQILNPVSSRVFTSYYAYYCNLTGTLDVSGLTGLGGNFGVGSNPNLTQIINPDSSQIFSQYRADNCNLTGTLDVSKLTGLGNYFNVRYNPKLTRILNPVSSQVVNNYDADNCNLTGTLDVSGFTKLGGGFGVSGNPNLTQIINPASSTTFVYYFAYSCNLTGTLDVSKLTGLGRRFSVNNNPNLTQIINPTSTQTFDYYQATGCNLTGTLDVSKLTGLGGGFQVSDNPNLTQIINPTSSQIFSEYWVNNCSLNGTLNVSGLTGLGGNFNVYNNPNLTQIINPTSSQYISYYAYHCNLTGTLDVSKLSNLSSYFDVHNNPNLTSLILPVFNNSFWNFDASGCGLNTTTVDNIFAKMDTWYNTHDPFGTVTINVASGTNAAPTNCWDNVNIVHLKSRFITLGRTLNIYINASCGSPPVGTKILEFTTNASTQAFDPSFGVSAGTLNWNLGDGSISNANSFSYNYTTTGNKTVKVYAGTTAGSTAITSVNMQYDDLIGTLDVSKLTGLGSYFNVDNNPNLTQIINPTSTQTFNSYHAHNCNLTGTLDVSKLTNLGNDFDVGYNYNLTQIINPTSSQIFTSYKAPWCNLTGTLDISGLYELSGIIAVNNNYNLKKIINPFSYNSITSYYVYDCSLSGTLDISGFIGLGGDFVAYSNYDLTQILNPVSSEVFTSYYAYNCNLTGTLDVSGLTGLGGSFQVYNNPNLTKILLSTITQEFTQFDASTCALDIFTVDDIFAKFNTWYNSNPPTQNLTINVASGTNSPPTNGSTNINIVNCVSIFNYYVHTFTYYINT